VYRDGAGERVLKKMVAPFNCFGATRIIAADNRQAFLKRPSCWTPDASSHLFRLQFVVYPKWYEGKPLVSAR